jgi:hypothetical protein
LILVFIATAAGVVGLVVAEITTVRPPGLNAWRIAALA